MRHVRWLVLWLLCVPSLAHGQAWYYYMNPLNLRAYYATDDCEPPDEGCVFTGIYLGLENATTSLSNPQYFVGVDNDQRARGAGNVTSMTGAQLYTTCQNGGTCSAIYGVDSEVFMGTYSGVPSAVTNIYHFLAIDSEAGNTIGTSYGLYYLPDAGDGVAYTIYSPIALAQILNAGPVNLGNATSTPGATPTATSATPTTTGASPTPTATSTPKHLFKEDIAIDGNVTLIGNAARSINVGQCTVSPCAGKAFTQSAGSARTAGVGGSYDITSGAGGGFSAGGNITHTVGGAANIIETARRGLFSIGGLFKVFGDVILGAATSGTRPTFGAGCGSTASDALATNNQGRITMSGTGQTGSCVVTFGDSGFTNIPVCVAQFAVDGGLAGHGIKTVLETTTTVTIANAVLATGIAQNFAANDVVKYWCVGRE